MTQKCPCYSDCDGDGDDGVKVILTFLPLLDNSGVSLSNKYLSECLAEYFSAICTKAPLQ